MSQLLFTEGTAPPTPSANKVTFYAKTDGKLYKKDDAGVETELALVDGAYGAMSVEGNAVAETSVDATPRKIAAFDTDGLENQMTVDSTTGDDITADVAGIFMVSATCSFSGTNSKTFHIEIYKNGASTGFIAGRKLGTGGDLGAVPVQGLLSLVATDTISLYQYSSDGGTAMTVVDAQLIAHRIST